MADVFSLEMRTRIMSSIRGKDTKPEMVIRRLLHGQGYRYRVHENRLPGTPDLYFSSREKAVFVNGCFWHGHENCLRASLPKTNRNFWRDKIRKNIIRDQKKCLELNEMGIEYLVVWECELSDIGNAARKLMVFLGPPKHV